MSEFIPVQAKKKVQHHPTISQVFPASSRDIISFTQYPGQETERNLENLPVSLENGQSYSQQVNRHPARNDNLSVNYNSAAIKSNRRLTSNYAVNDNTPSIADYEGGDNLEGTYAFKNFTHFNGYNNEFLVELNYSERLNHQSSQEQLQPHVHQSFIDDGKNDDEGFDFQGPGGLIVRPDTGNANFLTETEVRAIVLQFNECLDKHSQEKIELEKRVKQIIEKIDDKQATLIKLFKEKEDLQMENENVFIKYEQAITQFKKLQKFRDNFFNNEETENTDPSTVANQEIKFDLEASKSQRIQALRERKNQLLKANKELSELMLTKFHEQKVQEKKCVKCKQLFIPLHNQSQSCKFHQGKMKFFSCKGCGADQYYDCCNRCSTCSKGCRAQKHVA